MSQPDVRNPRPLPTTSESLSLLVAYLLLFTLGFCGLHHYYLNRIRQFAAYCSAVLVGLAALIVCMVSLMTADYVKESPYPYPLPEYSVVTVVGLAVLCSSIAFIVLMMLFDLVTLPFQVRSSYRRSSQRRSTAETVTEAPADATDAPAAP